MRCEKAFGSDSLEYAKVSKRRIHGDRCEGCALVFLAHSGSLHSGKRCCCLETWRYSIADIAATVDYPLRPIRLMVPFAAGGTSDILGRILSARMRRRSHQG
jgi:hypothetical protein